RGLCFALQRHGLRPLRCPLGLHWLPFRAAQVRSERYARCPMRPMLLDRLRLLPTRRYTLRQAHWDRRYTFRAASCRGSPSPLGIRLAEAVAKERVSNLAADRLWSTPDRWNQLRLPVRYPPHGRDCGLARRIRADRFPAIGSRWVSSLDA